MDLEAGRARIEVEEGGMDPREIPEAIRKAGFTPGRVEITAVGELRSSEEGLDLHLLGGPLDRLPLTGEQAQDLEPDRRLRVTGELEYPDQAEDGPYRLWVEEVAEVDGG